MTSLEIKVGSQKKIRVMIVEDSDVVRTFLEQIYNEDPRLEVVASVSSGEKALEVLKHIGPDVISLDIRLPGINGIDTAQRIMHERPTPIVVVAASIDEDELNISMRALRAGALAVVEKPVGVNNTDYDVLAAKLCRQLVLMSDVNVVRQRKLNSIQVLPPSVYSHVRPQNKHKSMSSNKKFMALGIVASTGGPSAIVQVLNGLGASFPLPILLVQHITPSFHAGFVDWLNGVVPFTVVIAQNGDLPSQGSVYVAPADRHLCVVGNRLQCIAAPQVAGQRPSGTVLLDTMGKSYGDRAIGVVLTGMGADGAEGLKVIHDRGGYTIAEDESTAVVFGMPGAAIKLGGVEVKLPIHHVAGHLLELTQHLRIRA